MGGGKVGVTAPNLGLLVDLPVVGCCGAGCVGGGLVGWWVCGRQAGCDGWCMGGMGWAVGTRGSGGEVRCVPWGHMRGGCVEGA